MVRVPKLYATRSETLKVLPKIMTARLLCLRFKWSKRLNNCKNSMPKENSNTANATYMGFAFTKLLMAQYNKIVAK